MAQGITQRRYTYRPCACGGFVEVRWWAAIGIYSEPHGNALMRGVQQHQATEQHRDWADGPAFRQWQDQATLKGQNQ